MQLDMVKIGTEDLIKQTQMSTLHQLALLTKLDNVIENSLEAEDLSIEQIVRETQLVSFLNGVLKMDGDE